MEITEVKVFPAKESGSRLRAYATIVFDNCFIIRDLKIIDGDKGLFVSMPSRRRKDGTFRDIVHPLNSETRSMIENSVIEEYNRLSASGELGEVAERD
jgi:stage V sporulation protein G